MANVAGVVHCATLGMMSLCEKSVSAQNSDISNKGDKCQKKWRSIHEQVPEGAKGNS